MTAPNTDLWGCRCLRGAQHMLQTPTSIFPATGAPTLHLQCGPALHPAGAVYKLHDENNNPLSTEYGLCKYRNHQVITVQELPETAPAGQLPRSAEVSRLLQLHINLCLHHGACPGRGLLGSSPYHADLGHVLAVQTQRRGMGLQHPTLHELSEPAQKAEQHLSPEVRAFAEVSPL